MGKYLTKIEIQFIQNALQPSTPHIIMDVGAEAGRFSQLNANTQTISIDIDPYGLKRLKQKAPNTHVIQADARKIPLQNETLDAITMIEVLDYIPELDQAFSEACRTLKPDSPVIVSFGNKSSPKAKLRQLGGKTYLHAYDNVVKALIEAGFIIKKKTGYNWLPFGRMSQNFMVPLLTSAESIFGLRRIPSLSPWVIIHAAKPK